VTCSFTHLPQTITAPSYLVDDLCCTTNLKAQRRLRSASLSLLIVRRTQLSTIGDRSFPVAAARVWNSLPQYVSSAPSLIVFRSQVKTHLFGRSFH